MKDPKSIKEVKDLLKMVFKDLPFKTNLIANKMNKHIATSNNKAIFAVIDGTLNFEFLKKNNQFFLIGEDKNYLMGEFKGAESAYYFQRDKSFLVNIIKELEN